MPVDPNEQAAERWGETQVKNATRNIKALAALDVDFQARTPALALLALWADIPDHVIAEIAEDLLDGDFINVGKRLHEAWRDICFTEHYRPAQED